MVVVGKVKVCSKKKSGLVVIRIVAINAHSSSPVYKVYDGHRAPVEPEKSLIDINFFRDVDATIISSKSTAT